jgi:hypothetical protein
MLKYLARIGIALSVLLNVILGGPSNQTFSARNWGRKRRGQINLVWLIDGVCDYILEPATNFVLTYVVKTDKRVVLKDHCMTSWIYWRIRKDVVHEHETAIEDIETEEWRYLDNMEN